MPGKRRFCIDYELLRDVHRVRDFESGAYVCDQLQSTVDGISDYDMALLVTKGLNRLAEEGEFDLDDRKGERRINSPTVTRFYRDDCGSTRATRAISDHRKDFRTFWITDHIHKQILWAMNNTYDERRGERRKVRGTRKDRR